MARFKLAIIGMVHNLLKMMANDLCMHNLDNSFAEVHFPPMLHSSKGMPAPNEIADPKSDCCCEKSFCWLPLYLPSFINHSSFHSMTVPLGNWCSNPLQACKPKKAYVSGGKLQYLSRDQTIHI